MKMMKTPAAPAETKATEPVEKRELPATQPAALLRMQNAGTLVGQSMARNAANGAATAMLPFTGRFDTATEWFALQGAVATRLGRLQQGWMQGWSAWLQDCARLRQADTLSEHVEQQYNLAARVGALCTQQATDLLALQENFEVDYGYWVAQQTRKGLPG